MRRSHAVAVPLVLALAAALPAAAKDKKAPATLRYAHSYADAWAEAKDRNCIIFVTVHGDT
jgi:hypothetical protein